MSQTLDDSVKVVQPGGARPAERRQTRATDKGVLVDAAVVQPSGQRPPVEPLKALSSAGARGVLKDSRVGDAATIDNSIRSKPMNRTVQAYLETHRHATGLPPMAMVCQDCEPAPPCGVYGCRGRNSSIIDGATIVVMR